MTRRARRRAPLLGAMLLCACARGEPRAPAARVLDDFEAAAAWSAAGSDGVLASADSVPGQSGQALRLSFDFQGHGGHVGVRRALGLTLPPHNYEVSLFVRGSAPANDLQFKLLDASGDNVWWFRRKDFVVSSEWQRLSFKKRQLEFAWGPTHDRSLHSAAALELVLAAGQGGRGSIEFDGLTIRELPEPPAVPPRPIASASDGSDQAPLVLDGNLDTTWTAASGRAQTLELDLGYAREFGGLVLRWAPGAFASDYDVELSHDRTRWERVRHVIGGNGGRDALLLTESEARYVRLRLNAGPGPRYALAELEVKDLGFGASPNAFLAALAREAPRGRYPRAFVGEQPYWTLVGVDGGADSGLLSEDGALELGRGRVSLEPFVVRGSELTSWADVELSQSLEDGYLPIPTVSWRHPEWELRVTAFASGDAGHADLVARYELTNRTDRPLEQTLLLAVRPLQVNPPTQFLNQVGGFTPVRALDFHHGSLSVNGVRTLLPLVVPARVALSSFDAAEFPERLPSPGAGAAAVADDTGLGSAVLEYPLSLAPGASAVIALRAPLLGAEPRPTSPIAELAREQAAVAAAWHERLDRVEIRVPPAGQRLVDTLRSSLAHILLSRDGPMLRPGTRSYGRSWIRDGAMMSESLLRLGHEAVAQSYFDWYAPRQFDSGKVPCCVDARGADPVPEHDSSGELIFLAAELYRFTRDRERLVSSWPHVAAAAEYLDGLRREERAAHPHVAAGDPTLGLLPPSISHEGYSDKPAYSYWDDFWALIGYQDATWLAEIIGDPEARRRLSRSRDEFREAVYTSVRASAARYAISFIPGAADRGDFDATSTTIALAPGREGPHLPRDLLLGTFERYWDEFTSRRSGGTAWGA